MVADERLEVRAADLLLALEDDADVDWQRPGLPEVCLERLDVHEQLPLVVGGAARVDPPVADRRLEGGGRPQLHGVGRLDVVVPVDEDRGPPGRTEPLAAHDRVPLRRVNLGRRAAGLAEPRLQPRSRPGDVVPPVGVRAHGGNPKELRQLVQVALTVLREVAGDGAHRSPPSRVRSRGPTLVPSLSLESTCLPRPIVHGKGGRRGGPAAGKGVGFVRPGSGAMVKFLLWCILLILCWPLALLALLLWPVAWLVSLPFRLIGITVGAVQNSDIAVLSGLEAGERIVTAGVHHLRDNMPVRPLQP